MRVLIIGCGYVGVALGKELARLGHQVSGVRRSTGAASELRSAGIQPLIADITEPGALQQRPADWDWVVNCIGSSAGTAEDYRRTYLEGTRHVLDWLRARPPGKFVYTSSTSVYGQDDGSWVDESDETTPPTETGAILVETEKLLLRAAVETGFPAVVLRLAGIYGPGRGYWLKQFLSGEAQLEADERFLNMIHRDDAVGAILAALERGKSGSVYNVSDNEPASQRTIFTWLAQRLNRPLPPVASEPKARRRGATNKRISNRRLREELGCTLRYPTFREGYAAELAAAGI